MTIIATSQAEIAQFAPPRGARIEIVRSTQARVSAGEQRPREQAHEENDPDEDAGHGDG